MFRKILAELASRALDNLCIALVDLWELAWLNRRMTAKGLVAVLVFVAAHFGFEISAEAQVYLATGLFLYLGLAGRDKPREVRRG